MALMAFQFENADAIRIKSGSNVTLANIAKQSSGAGGNSFVEPRNGVWSHQTSAASRPQAGPTTTHADPASCTGAGGAPVSMKREQRL
jgi:hypothetical protein